MYVLIVNLLLTLCCMRTWEVKGQATDDKRVEIPITPEIKAALLAANPDLFGTFEHPMHAACRCKLEPFDLTPYKARRFHLPTSNPRWTLFMKKMQESGTQFNAQQLDKVTGTINWGMLEMFEDYLKHEKSPEMPMREILKLLVNSSETASGTASASASMQMNSQLESSQSQMVESSRKDAIEASEASEVSQVAQQKSAAPMAPAVAPTPCSSI